VSTNHGLTRAQIQQKGRASRTKTPGEAFNEDINRWIEEVNERAGTIAVQHNIGHASALRILVKRLLPQITLSVD